MCSTQRVKTRRLLRGCVIWSFDRCTENSSTPHQTRPRPLSLTGLEAKCYATPDASGKPASRPAGLISTLPHSQGGIARAH